LQYKTAIRFSIQGDVRFISHHDAMRLFRRALARAGLPVKYSEGFNPHPRLSLPLPRPVGMASEAELLVVELERPLECGEVLERLSAQMPEGLTLEQAWSLASKRAVQPESVDYEIELSGREAGIAREGIERIARADTWMIQRGGREGKKEKAIDVKASLVDVRLDGECMCWTQRLPAGGSMRPAEWLECLGLDAPQLAHRIVRKRVDWANAEESAGSIPG